MHAIGIGLFPSVSTKQKKKKKKTQHCNFPFLVEPSVANPNPRALSPFSVSEEYNRKTVSFSRNITSSCVVWEKKTNQRESERVTSSSLLRCCDAGALIPNAPIQPATEQRALDAVASAVAAPVAEAPPWPLQGRAVLSQPGRLSNRRAAAQLDLPLRSAPTTRRFPLRASHLHLRHAPLHGNRLIRRRSGH